MESYSGSDFFNIGTGIDFSISELADIIKKITGFNGKIVYDTSKPDGMPQKLLDVSKIKNTGWAYKTKLQDGLRATYRWYLKNYDKFNGGNC